MLALADKVRVTCEGEKRGVEGESGGGGAELNVGVSRGTKMDGRGVADSRGVANGGGVADTDGIRKKSGCDVNTTADERSKFIDGNSGSSPTVVSRTLGVEDSKSSGIDVSSGIEVVVGSGMVAASCDGEIGDSVRALVVASCDGGKFDSVKALLVASCEGGKFDSVRALVVACSDSSITTVDSSGSSRKKEVVVPGDAIVTRGVAAADGVTAFGVVKETGRGGVAALSDRDTDEGSKSAKVSMGTSMLKMSEVITGDKERGVAPGDEERGVSSGDEGRGVAREGDGITDDAVKEVAVESSNSCVSVLLIKKKSSVANGVAMGVSTSNDCVCEVSKKFSIIAGVELVVSSCIREVLIRKESSVSNGVVVGAKGCISEVLKRMKSSGTDRVGVGVTRVE